MNKNSRNNVFKNANFFNNFLASNRDDVFASISLVFFLVISALLIVAFQEYSLPLSLGLLTAGYLFFKPLKFIYFIILIRPTLELWSFSGLGTEAHQVVNVNALVAFFVIIFTFFHLYGLPAKRLKELIFGDPISKILLLFLGYLALVSVFRSEHLVDSIFDIGRIFSILSIYYLAKIYGPKTQAEFRKLLLVLIYSSILPVIYGLQAYLRSEFVLAFGSVNRLRGFFVNPVAFSQFLAFIIISCVALVFLRKGRLKKWIIYLYLMVIIFSSLKTYGKGGWFGAIVGFFILASFEQNIKKKYKWTAAVIIVLILIVILTPSLELWFKRILDTTNPTQSSFATRLFIWKYLIGVFQNKPFFGHGFGSSYEILTGLMGRRFAAHNDYLRILIEGGIFGLILYGILVAAIFRFLFLFRRKLERKNNPGEFYARYSIALFSCFFLMATIDNIITSLLLQYPIWVFLGSLKGRGIFQEERPSMQRVAAPTALSDKRL